MRNLLLLFAGLVCVLCSCESEYNQRMGRALELKKELDLIMGNDNIRNKEILYSELQKQIRVQAKISGNESLFYRQLGINEVP